MTLSQLVELFNAYNRQTKRPRTADFYRDHLKKVVQVHGDMDAALLRPHHLLQFKTTWHLVLCVQRLFKWAVDEQDLLTVNPMLKLKRPRLGVRRRILSPAELARYLRGARPAFRRYLLFARDSAARPQELTALGWEALRWEGPFKQLHEELCQGRAYFELGDFKGRSRRADPSAPRVIPITPRLGRLLWRMAHGRALSGLVLVNDQGKPWNRNSLRMQMRRLRERVDPAAAGSGERIVCYSMRHTALTSYVAQGMQTSIVQTLAGHANIRTTQRYIHLHRRNLMDTWREFWSRRPIPGEK
jgi:integrase